MTESEQKDAAVLLNSERSNLHLAHWPPPARSDERESTRSKRKIKEHVHLAHRRGYDRSA